MLSSLELRPSPRLRPKESRAETDKSEKVSNAMQLWNLAVETVHDTNVLMIKEYNISDDSVGFETRHQTLIELCCIQLYTNSVNLYFIGKCE